MEKINDYNQMKDAIYSVMANGIIDTNDETISLYEFIDLCNEYLKPVFDINKNSYYITQFNRNLTNGLNKDQKYYNKEDYRLMKRFGFHGIEVDPSTMINHKATILLYLHRNIPLRRAHYYFAQVENINNDLTITDCQPYYTSHNFYIKNSIFYSEDFLKTLINYVDEYRYFIRKIAQYRLYENKFVKVKLCFDKDGINPVILPNSESLDTRLFYNKNNDDSSIEDYVLSNKDLILWSLPVNIKDIPEELQDLLKKKRNVESLNRILTK